MAGVGEQSQSHNLINDFDFLRPANETILQNSLNQAEIKEQGDNLMVSNKSNRTILNYINQTIQKMGKTMKKKVNHPHLKKWGGGDSLKIAPPCFKHSS